MGKIVIEFGTPNAKDKARTWKQEIISAIEKAISNLKSQNGTLTLFKEEEFSVYFTFEEPTKP